MLRLGNLSGTKADMTVASILVLDGGKMEMSPTGMQKLNLSEGDRVDVADGGDGSFYVAKCSKKSEGRHISKHGRFQSTSIHSWLADEVGENGRLEISDETVEHEGLNWHKLQPVSAEAADSSEEDADAQQVGAEQMNAEAEAEADASVEAESQDEEAEAVAPEVSDDELL